MTNQRKLKKEVRARQQKTGESYVEARRQVTRTKQKHVADPRVARLTEALQDLLACANEDRNFWAYYKNVIDRAEAAVKDLPPPPGGTSVLIEDAMPVLDVARMANSGDYSVAELRAEADTALRAFDRRYPGVLKDELEEPTPLRGKLEVAGTVDVGSVWEPSPTCVECDGTGRDFDPSHAASKRCKACKGTGTTIGASGESRLTPEVLAELFRDPGEDLSMLIDCVVNGKAMKLPVRSSMGRICEAAGVKPESHPTLSHYTKHRHGAFGGLSSAGSETVKNPASTMQVEPGTIFNVVVTSSA